MIVSTFPGLNHVATSLNTHVSLTSKDARAKEQVGPQQFQFIAWFCGTGVLRVKGVAIKVCCRVCDSGLLGCGCHDLREAGPIHARSASLHAFGITGFDLIACVTSDLAALLGNAVVTNFCTFFGGWNHNDLTELHRTCGRSQGWGLPRQSACGKNCKQPYTSNTSSRCSHGPLLSLGRLDCHTIRILVEGSHGS